MARGDGSSFFSGLMFGALVGGVAALLLAPKSGEETRKDLKKMSDDAQNKAKLAYEDAQKKAMSTYDEARTMLQSKVQTLKDAGNKVDETKYKELVTELVEDFKANKQTTSDAAKKLGEQLRGDWMKVRNTLGL